jgi:quinol monooxygenase YgiN
LKIASATISSCWPGREQGQRVQRSESLLIRGEKSMPKRAEKEIVCIAQFTAKPGKEDEFIAALHSLMAPTHKEKGCIRYELNQNIDNPRVITFIEKFASREDFDLHCSMSYIKAHFEKSPQWVESQSITLHREILP